MRHLRRLLIVSLTVTVCLLFGISTASAHGSGGPQNVTCSGGVIAPGDYGVLKVTGSCLIPGGTVVVHNRLFIGSNAALDAATQAPTLIVRGNVFVGHNGIFLLGCSEAFSPPCPSGVTTSDVIDGNVVAIGALALIFHSNSIYGNLTQIGGGGGVNCNPNDTLQGSPVYSTYEDNWIGGRALVNRYQSCWFGFIRNHVHGSVTLKNNTLADPDAMEVVTNTIQGNLRCSGNSPAPQVGDSQGQPNVVFGKKTGQCAAIQ
jgi:hypothetical protein